MIAGSPVKLFLVGAFSPASFGLPGKGADACIMLDKNYFFSRPTVWARK